MAKRITIKFIGSATDKQDVRLSDFIDQLEGIKKALRENERSMSGEEEVALDYKIVDLRHRSPSEMDLEPVTLREVPKAYGNEIIAGFAKDLRFIRKQGKTFHEPELNRLQAYQDIGTTRNGQLAGVEISIGRTHVAIDEFFHGRLEKIMGPDEFVSGSISGFLEAVNFHNTNRFTLYPTLGPRKVVGKFPAHLRGDVKAAIGSFVTIEGQLAYKSWAPFAHAIAATKIVPHKPDAELPSLFDLKGTMPDLTGKESSVEFVERIRDEGW
jgi:hypothetical protein